MKYLKNLLGMVVCLAIMGQFLPGLRCTARRYQAQTTFTQATAVILESSVKKGFSAKQWPQVRYSYMANGLEQTGNLVAYSQGDVPLQNQHWVGSLQKGAVLPVFYDPAQPENSVLLLLPVVGGMESMMLMLFVTVACGFILLLDELCGHRLTGKRAEREIGGVPVEETAREVRAWLQESSLLGELAVYCFLGVVAFCVFGAIAAIYQAGDGVAFCVVHGIRLGLLDGIGALVWSGIVVSFVHRCFRIRAQRRLGVGQLIVDRQRGTVSFWSLPENTFHTLPLAHLESLTLDADREFSGRNTVRQLLKLKVNGGTSYLLWAGSVHCLDSEEDSPRAFFEWLRTNLELPDNRKMPIKL